MSKHSGAAWVMHGSLGTREVYSEMSHDVVMEKMAIRTNLGMIDRSSPALCRHVARAAACACRRLCSRDACQSRQKSATNSNKKKPI